MITRTEFDDLTALEKAYALFEEGDELDTRQEGDFRIKLYLVSDFFVELWVGDNNAHDSKLLSLSEDEVLRIYDERIDISPVF